MSDSNSSASKDGAALMWILTIFFSWIPPLIFYITKKEDAFVFEESKQALNLSLNFFIVALVISIAASILASIVGILGTLLTLLSLVVWAGFAYVCYLNWKSVKTGSPKPTIPYLIQIIK